jgi:hypothetical protein
LDPSFPIHIIQVNKLLISLDFKFLICVVKSMLIHTHHVIVLNEKMRESLVNSQVVTIILWKITVILYGLLHHSLCVEIFTLCSYGSSFYLSTVMYHRMSKYLTKYYFWVCL